MSIKNAVTAKYNIVEAEVTPLPHFSQDDWSIQTERTHGIKGLVKVTKAAMENPKLALKLESGLRFAGAEDLFRGTKQAVKRYVYRTFPNTKKIQFV